jgi:hypothetical protein
LPFFNCIDASQAEKVAPGSTTGAALEEKAKGFVGSLKFWWAD